MHLGALIQRLQSETDAGLAMKVLDDPALFSDVSSMARRYDETPAVYVALAAGRFANLAGDQDWLDIVGAAERDPDPARAVLQRILRWSLRRDEREQAALCKPGNPSGEAQ